LIGGYHSRRKWRRWNGEKNVFSSWKRKMEQLRPSHYFLFSLRTPLRGARQCFHKTGAVPCQWSQDRRTHLLLCSLLDSINPCGNAGSECSKTHPVGRFEAVTPARRIYSRSGRRRRPRCSRAGPGNTAIFHFAKNHSVSLAICGSGAKFHKADSHGKPRTRNRLSFYR